MKRQQPKTTTHASAAPASNGADDEGWRDDGKHELVEEEEGEGDGGRERCHWCSPHVVHQAIGGRAAKDSGVDAVTKCQREPVECGAQGR